MNLYQQQQRLQNFNIQDLTGSTHPSQVPLQAAPLPPFNANADFFNDMQQRVATEDNGVTVGSLPNIPGPATAMPPCSYHHQTIAQRHSMGVCQTLATPPSLSETQSAPTSPAQSVELQAPTSWPQRNYSNSPEPREIPNIVLTGTDGQLDCFQDLQDLHLDANELQQLLNSGEHVDPACETQLLE
ncbi:unnamed protein product [Gongylonema pulchrum]|uniref:TORC_C domain-containing protein n=1 Tax=Gongylonema pulchrum TaxID=637853 RepID=A0A183DJF9_9BILA|nr:unnamed protein product [Gongylonema pulchrum]